MPKLTKDMLKKYFNSDFPKKSYVKVGMSSCGIASGADDVL